MKTPYQMVADMMATQAALNDYAYPQWKDEPPNYYLAMVSECAELADAVGWKWWKKQEPRPLVQIQFEVVDLWHFVMSQLMSRGRHGLVAALPDIMRKHQVHGGNKGPVSLQTFKYMGEMLSAAQNIEAGTVAQNNSTHQNMLNAFGCLMYAVRLSIADLYRLYVMKSALNLFRWDNGYGNGTYIKDWLGEEDTDYLGKIIDGQDYIDASDLRKALSLRYEYVLSQQKED